MENQQTPGGSKIFRHTKLDEPVAAAAVNTALAAEIRAHIGKHLGTPQKTIRNESPFGLLEVCVVFPTPQQPCYTLVTSGMSYRAMGVPSESNAPDRVELVLCIPADWDIESLAMPGSTRNWILGVLGMIARLPHAVGTWVGDGHTIPKDENGSAYSAETTMVCALVAKSHMTPEGFHTLSCKDGTIVRFLGLWFLNREEMEFKLEHGHARLMERLIKANTSELIELDRPGFSRQLTIPDDLFGTSFAARPARISTRPEDLNVPFGYLVRRAKIWMLVGGWFVVGALFSLTTPEPLPRTIIVLGGAALLYGWYKASKTRKVIANFRTVFQHGALVPGILVGDDGAYTVAVLVNMAHSGGSPWWIVEVATQMIVPNPKYSLSVGDRVPTVCGFFRAEGPSTPEAMSRWASVYVSMAQLGNSDPAVISELLSRFSDDEWRDLRRALGRIPQPIKPGTYRVSEEDIAGTTPPKIG